jgi:hypothetical protein
MNGDNSDQAEWYKKIKAKIGRLIFLRRLHESPNAQDTAERELFAKHLRALCCALARANTAEGARRKFGLKTLWYTAGRGGEPGLLSYEGMRWNELFECMTIESAQSKPSKLKFAVFLAGFDHLIDWAIDLGDMLVWEKGNRTFNADEKTWLLPELYKAGSATTLLTDWIKAMQPSPRSGALQRYAHVAITREEYGVDLPPQPTAKGFRHGSAETICIGVSAELAVHNTGHDLTGMTALFEYLGCRIPLCVPGGVLLAGWQGLPYGQLGDGSKYPSLQTLVDGGVSMQRLEVFVDKLFCFHDASPPMLLIDGMLRPLMHAVLATMIMYYETRFKSKESVHVNDRMRDTYDEVISTPGFDGHRVLIEWGDTLKRQFDIDNTHLRDRTNHGPSEQMVAALKGLGATMGRMHAQISELGSRVVNLEQQNQMLLQQNQQLLQPLLLATQQILAGSPARPLSTGPPRATPESVAAPAAAPPVTPLGGSPSGRAFMHAAAVASAGYGQTHAPHTPPRTTQPPPPDPPPPPPPLEAVL